MAGELFSGGVARRSCCDSYGNEWHARPCNVNGPTGLGPSGVGCFSPVPSVRCGGDGCQGCAWCEHVGPKIVETDLIPPGPILVGEFTTSKTCRVPDCDHDPDNLSCANPGRWGEQGTVGCAMEDIFAGDQGLVMLNPREAQMALDYGFPRSHVMITPDIPNGKGIVGDFTSPGTDTVRALIPHRWCCGGLPTDRHLDGCPTNFFAEGQAVIKPDLNVMDPWGRARLRIAEDRVSSDRTFENETRPL